MSVVGAAVAIARAVAEQANPHLADENGFEDLHDRCQWTVRTLLGIGPGAASAKAAWQAVPVSQRHGHLPPPPGHPVFFQTANWAWHVTLSDFEPWWVWSTDIKRKGKLDRVPKSLIQDRWNAPYLGWTDSLNGVMIPT